MRIVTRVRPVLVALLVLGAVTLGGCATLRSSGSGGSGSVWLWDNPRMAGDYLFAVDFVDGQEGWAVGWRGTILHTRNAGAGDPPSGRVVQTRTEYSGTRLALNGVAALDSYTVWAVGQQGTILRTVNGGQTWLPLESHTGYDLNAVTAKAQNRVWAVGGRGTIRRWDGTLWRWQTSGTTSDLLTVDFLDTTTGWIGGRNRTLLKTTNGGANWTSITTTLPASAEIRSLSFASASVGYAATWDGGEGALWRTEDGGATWTKMLGESGRPLDSVTASGTQVWATGATGFAFYTDGSTTTTAILSRQELRGTTAAGDKAWAVGENGRVYAWQGGTWVEKSSIATLENLSGYSAVAQWAVGARGTVVRWSGEPFTNAPGVMQLPTESDLTAVVFTSASTGWVTARDGTVFRVTGGSVSGTSAVGVAPTSIATTNGTDIWLAGNVLEDGYVLKSSDGGSTWTTETGPRTNVRYHGIAARGSRVYAVGGHSFGRSDTDIAVYDGSTWRDIEWGGKPLRGVYAVSDDTIVAVGEWGYFARSKDGGDTWAPVSVPGAIGFVNGVSFSDESNGLAVGDSGTIFATSDGGATWARQDSGTYDALTAVDVSEGGARRVVGTSGAVLIQATVETKSLAGASRYDTAIEVSRNTWGAGEATSVVIATGENWPDAVSGSSLAGAVEGPMLLTRRTTVPNGLVVEMKRLGAVKAYLLGSERVIDPVVENALKAQMGAGFSVERIAGADRYETSARIAAVTVREIEARGGTYDGSAFLTTGLNWPDALAAAPVAARAKEPILLARPTGIPGGVVSTIESLDVTSGVVLGSVNAVPASVASQFESAIGTTPARWYGATRYDTASQIASGGINTRGLGSAVVALATGYDFPDALGGGVAQGRLNGPLLLTPSGYLAPAAGTFLWERGPTELRFVGGVNVLPLRPRDEAVWVLTSGF